MRIAIAIIVMAACTKQEPAGPPVHAAPPPSPADAATVVDDEPVGKPERVAPVYLPIADPWKGPRKRYATAVLLVSARPAARTDEDMNPEVAYRFVPVVCSVNGKLSTGKTCGEAMPARATVRIPTGELVVARSTKAFHDTNGDHTYPAPYGPECCMYNTCIGNTIPYTPAGADKPKDHRTVLAVWPPDADLELEVASDDPHARDLPPMKKGHGVAQAFSRGAHHFASIGTSYSGALTWNSGAGWIGPTDADIGPRGYVILGTTDVDHDGALEILAWEIWANDYGVALFTEPKDTEVYGWSCGNI